MERNKRLLKTTIIYFIGTFGSKLLVFFLMPIYAAHLSTEQFGAVNLVTNLVPLIGPVFTLQVTETIFRFLCTSKSDIEKKQYISNTFIIYLFGVLTFLIIYIPISIITKFEYPYLFILYFVFNYLSMYLQQVLRGMKKNIDYSITGIVSTLIQLIINILLIKYIHERSILVATIVGAIVIAIYSFIRIKFYKYIDVTLFNKKIIKDMLKYSLPLVPNQISWWLNGTAGLYILKYFCGVSATGLVSFANKFPTLIMTVNSIFLMAWTENSIYEFESKDKDEYYSKNLQNFTKFLILLAAILLPIVKIYYELFINETYKISSLLVPLMFVSMGFNAVATFMGTIYTASMKTRGAFNTTVIAAVTNIIFTIILIPIIGIYGYVIANIFSYVVFYAVRKVSIGKIIKLEDNYKQYIVPSIIFIISSLIYYKASLICNAIGVILQLGIMMYIYRDLIIKISKKYLLLINKSKNKT